MAIVFASARPVAHFLGLAQKAVAGQDPEESLRSLTELRGELDALERAHVSRALRSGCSWSRIAAALGVSKQAAHRRHRDLASSAVALEELVQQGGSPAKVLVTSEARQTVRLARAEARALGHSRLGTEHLLLGLLRFEHGAARDALEAAGVSLDAARAAAQPKLVGAQPAGAPTAHVVSGDAITPHARAVLEQSLAETVTRGEGFIGPEHLLLAILGKEEGGAARTLATLGVEAGDVRRRLEAAL